MVLALRADFDAQQLRSAARKSKDAAQARPKSVTAAIIAGQVSVGECGSGR